MIDQGKFRSGDRGAFEAAIREFGGMVLAVVRSYAEDPDQAEDLFQEVWKRAYEHRRGYDGRGSLRGWLHRLAKHVCLSHVRARQRGDRTARAYQTEAGVARVGWRPTDPHTHAERRELHERLHRAMGTLSDREHEAITLRWLEGRTPDEVSEIMGITKATIRSTIRNGLKRLRQSLEDPDDEMSRNRSAH